MIDPAERGGQRYALTLLTVIYVFNFIDRQVINIVAEPIKTEFGLLDWQLGAMTGLSFAVVYTLAGIPIARWAEWGDRPRIVGLAVLTWSLFTASCGLAQNFAQLLLARIGVGLGEAGGTPPSHSLIVDITPVERRASALAIYSVGAPVGQLAGMAMGGLVASQWGWRSVFFVAAVPGILLGVLVLTTLGEPRRRAETDSATHAAPRFGATLRALTANRSYVLIAAATALSSFVAFGLAAFYGSFFLRNHAAQIAAAGAAAGLAPIAMLGLALGATGGVAGLIGSVAGGRIADAWRRRDPAGYVLFPAVCLIVTTPLLLAALLLPSFQGAVALIALAALASFAYTGSVFAAVLGLVPATSRATASAIILFLINLVGFGLGPLVIGLLSDALAPQYGPGDGLRYAMCCIVASSLLPAALFFAARTSIRADTIS